MDNNQEIEVLKSFVASTKITLSAVWDDITELRKRINNLEIELNNHKINELAHKV